MGFTVDPEIHLVQYSVVHNQSLTQIRLAHGTPARPLLPRPRRGVPLRPRRATPARGAVSPLPADQAAGARARHDALPAVDTARRAHRGGPSARRVRAVDPRRGGTG